jgi:hypothetical protein
MLDYSAKEKEEDSSYYHYVANKWFTDRQIGVSQKFTKLQNNFEVDKITEYKLCSMEVKLINDYKNHRWYFYHFPAFIR